MIYIEMRTVQSENILRNAYNLFKEKGYNKTTTREIAEASNINKGLLHYYFKKKEDIIFDMYSDFLNTINDFIGKEARCNNDALLYYGVFNIMFFRTISARDYFIEILNELVEYRNLTKLKIEKSTEMLYAFLKDLEIDITEYQLLLAITVAVGAEAELLLSVSDGRIKMTYDKVATTINKLLFTMLKVDEKEVLMINKQAMEIADNIKVEEIFSNLKVSNKWLQE